VRRSRRRTQQEGESEAEDEEEEAAAVAQKEGEGSEQPEGEEEEEEDGDIFLSKKDEEEEEKDEEEQEEEKEELEETESEIEETEEEDDDEQELEQEALRRTAALVAEREEAQRREDAARAAEAAVAARQAAHAAAAAATASEVAPVAAAGAGAAAQSSAVLLLLAFCTVGLLATSGLVLYSAGGAHGWGDGSGAERMWSEDTVAFLTDQRIAATVQADVTRAESALRAQMADLVASQVNGKSAKTEARVDGLAGQLQALLASVGQIQTELQEYRAAAAAAAAAPTPSADRTEDSTAAAAAAAAAAVQALEKSQRDLETQLRSLEAQLSARDSAQAPAADGAAPAQEEKEKEAMAEVRRELAALSGRMEELLAAAGDVEVLRADMRALLLERQRQHEELVSRYTRDLDALLAEVDQARKDASQTNAAVSSVVNTLEELSVPEMQAIEERVRVVLAAELAKLPAPKPGLERDHVQELINEALARENAGRAEPLVQADIERIVEQRLASVEQEVAGLKHAADSRPPPAAVPVVSVTEEAGAEIVEGERMRIMAWVHEAIDKARLAPSAPAATAQATPTPAAPAAYVRPEDVDLEQVKAAVMEDVYRLLFADAVGKPDYALASAGGRVVDYSGKWSLGRLAALVSPFPGHDSPVEAVIQRDTSLGACWPMAGSSGFVTVKLAQRVLVDSISLEHVSSSIAHNQESAPRDVRFWGYPTSGAKATFMGQFTYDINGREVQTFPVQAETDVAVSIVKMEVLSNHGHPDYTCIYRMRVHGSPVELQL